MTSQPIVERLLGLSGHPDPVKAAVSGVQIPPGVDPADIVQHCRIKVIVAASRYVPSKGRPFTFAYSVARLEALKFLRTHERRIKRLTELPRQLNSRTDQGRTPKREAMIDRVRQAVRQLPKDLRQVVRLVNLEENPKPLACEKLRISMRELNERLALAKGLLKRILSGKPVKAGRKANRGS